MQLLNNLNSKPGYIVKLELNPEDKTGGNLVIGTCSSPASILRDIDISRVKLREINDYYDEKINGFKWSFVGKVIND